MGMGTAWSYRNSGRGPSTDSHSYAYSKAVRPSGSLLQAVQTIVTATQKSAPKNAIEVDLVMSLGVSFNTTTPQLGLLHLIPPALDVKSTLLVEQRGVEHLDIDLIQW